MFASWMNRAAIFGIDIRKDRRFGKLDWLGNGRLRRWIGAFLGPAATVTTCSFFATILDHLHLLVAQVPTPQWPGRSAPDRKRRSVIRGKDSPTCFPWRSSRQYNPDAGKPPRIPLKIHCYADRQRLSRVLVGLRPPTLAVYLLLWQHHQESATPCIARQHSTFRARRLRSLAP